MNVKKIYKNLPPEQIKNEYARNTISGAVAMLHVTGDFNLSTMIRNANFFAYEKVFYIGGKRKYDRRGTVGTHHYISVEHIKTEELFIEYANHNNYELISVENNLENYVVHDFFEFVNNISSNNIKITKPLFLFGEEQKGISNYILNNSKYIVTINGNGTVPSINVGSASAIVLGGYANYIRNC